MRAEYSVVEVYPLLLNDLHESSRVESSRVKAILVAVTLYSVYAVMYGVK